MAVSKSEIKAFIQKISPYAIKAYRLQGKVLPSICIAMACVESRYGTAGSAKYHSYLGQKVGSGKTALKYWGGTYFNSKTSEEYKPGILTEIYDKFRTYGSMEQCVMNYYELLNSPVYKNVTAGVDYITQMKQIKAAGYMTSSSEVNTVISIIQNNHLTQYDPECRDICPYSEPRRAIKIGSRGKGVKWLQWKLNQIGYALKVDGVAGDYTIGAVIDFQIKNNLEKVDGICGQVTREKIKERAKKCI